MSVQDFCVVCSGFFKDLLLLATTSYEDLERMNGLTIFIIFALLFGLWIHFILIINLGNWDFYNIFELLGNGSF
jgi:hypothetical protein